MNIAKRAIAFALASVFTFGTLAFAAEDGNSVTITQRDSYIDENDNGNLRFLTEVNLDSGKEVEKFGTWVVPKSIFNGWDKNNVVTVENTTESDAKDLISSGGTFTTDIMGIPAALLSEEFYAKSFVVYKEKDDANAPSVWLQAPLASDNVNNSEAIKKNEALSEYVRHAPKHYQSTSGGAETATDNSDIDRSTAKFSKVFENTDKYLYRVGNGNPVKLSSLFSCEGTPINPTVTVTNKSGNAGGTYTPNSTWGNGTIQFTGTGVVEVAITDTNDPINNAECKLYLEVVDAVNATEMSKINATNNNVVLLNDIDFTADVKINGHALYGNGFTMTSPTDQPAASFSYSFVELTDGILDNVQVICPNFDYQALYVNGMSNSLTNSNNRSSGTSYYNARSGVNVAGNSKILNSRIAGARAAVCVAGGNVIIENSQLELGAIASLMVESGVKDLTLKDITLVQKPTVSTFNNPSKTIMGFSVAVMCDSSGNSAPITLEGDFVQNAWVNDNDKQYAGLGESVVNQVMSKTDYVHDIDDDGKNESLNLGFAYLSETTDVVAPLITDNRSKRSSIPYDSTAVTFAGHNTYVYSYKNSNGTDVSFIGSNDYTPEKYNFITPEFSLKNIDTSKPSEELTATYKYLDNDGAIQIQYQKADGSYILDVDSITEIKKYGQTLDYTVSCEGAAVSGKKVTFSESGTYTLQYNVTDENVYGTENGALNHYNNIVYTYTKTIVVTVPKIEISDAVISQSSTTGSAICNDVGSDSDFNFYIDILDGLTITDYTENGSEIVLDGTTTEGKQAFLTKATKNAILTCANTSENINDTATVKINLDNDRYLQIDLSKITYSKSPGKGKKSTDLIVEETPNSLYYCGYGGISHSNQGTSATCTISITKYTFKGNNGKTVEYSYTKTYTGNASTINTATFYSAGFTSGSGITANTSVKRLSKTESGGICVAEGTMITLADGTQKAIENLTGNEKILAWDFMTGKYASKDIALLVDHGKHKYRVANLIFSDGTILRLIGDHGVFDYEKNRFAYINDMNCKEFINHSFVKSNKTSGYDVIKLISAYVTVENVKALSVTSAGTMNAFASGLLTLAPPEDFYNWIEMGETMRYDTEQLEADIAKYGLYTYEDFADYVTEEQFIAFNGAYLKIPVEKGIFTFDYILELIAMYQEYMPR